MTWSPLEDVVVDVGDDGVRGPVERGGSTDAVGDGLLSCDDLALKRSSARAWVSICTVLSTSSYVLST
mgnify:CR=1 FL=1